MQVEQLRDGIGVNDSETVENLIYQLESVTKIVQGSGDVRVSVEAMQSIAESRKAINATVSQREVNVCIRPTYLVCCKRYFSYIFS